MSEGEAAPTLHPHGEHGVLEGSNTAYVAWWYLSHLWRSEGLAYPCRIMNGEPEPGMQRLVFKKQLDMHMNALNDNAQWHFFYDPWA